VRSSWRKAALLEALGLHGQRAVGLQREGGAVEHHLVLPADQVRVDQRQPHRGRARSAMRATRSPSLPTWNGEALITASTSAPPRGPVRAGWSNQASSQISRPT
jgi:hypothetical protein